MVEDGHTCVKAAQRPEMVQVQNTRAPAHGGVMLCTVQCRSASARAIKSPPTGCIQRKQDKTRQDHTMGPCQTTDNDVPLCRTFSLQRILGQ